MEKIIINQKEIFSVLQNPDSWKDLGINPRKGMLLLGNPGVGKTTAIKKWLRAQGKSNKAIDGFDLIEGCQTVGMPYLSSLKWERVLSWDDLGTEAGSVTYMGTVLAPGVNLIEARHKVFVESDGKFITHATSNLDTDDLEERYGLRVSSRLKEMFNIIIVTGEDLRK